MDGVLSQDMSRAVAEAGLSNVDKELIVNILFKERTKKNIVWDSADATAFLNGLLVDVQENGGKNGDF